jgi:hypothetical protein
MKEEIAKVQEKRPKKPVASAKLASITVLSHQQVASERKIKIRSQ